MAKLTKVQRAVLQQAAADGDEITLGGIDATEPRVRRDVVLRLVNMGLLYWDLGAGGFFSDVFRMTDEAKEIVGFKRN